jgi:hypothetical protein
MTTQLTVIERAAVALGSSKAEIALIELAGKSKSIILITNAAGRAECHAAAMVAKAARINVEKAGEESRADATAYAKAIISEAWRLAHLIAPEEERLIKLRNDYDDKIASEKAAKAEAERMRVAAINLRIRNIEAIPMLAAGSTSVAVQYDIDKLAAIEIDDSFKEFFGDASEAKADALEKLREIHGALVRAEAEALRIRAEQDAQFARIKAEREELARQRAEQEKRDSEAKTERDAEIKRIEAVRAEVAETQRLLKVEQDKAEQARLAEVNRIAAKRDAESLAVFLLHIPETSPEPADIAQAVTKTIFNDICDKINDYLAEMNEAEAKLVEHFCERLIAHRQQAE